jgi:hypothetical protein
MRLLRSFWFSCLLFFGVVGTSVAANIGKGTLVPVDTPPTTAQVVTVGFYPVSVYQLDLGSNTYFVDTYFWMRWKGDLDPTTSFEFANMVDEWGKLSENLNEEPKVLADGSKYQIMRVEGRFVQPFSLADYPLDQQKLSIIIEDTTNGADKISYVVDKESSGLGDSLRIPGWQINGWSSQTFAHDYGSKFGEEAADSTYSTAAFAIEIGRPASFFYWKLLMPLFMVLLAGFAALFLSPQNIDSRTALPAGALLTAIFLQKSYSDSLPDVGYLILMDKIYLVAYALIVVTLVRVITVFRSTNKASEAAIGKLAAADARFMVILTAIFTAATAAIVQLR